MTRRFWMRTTGAGALVAAVAVGIAMAAGTTTPQFYKQTNLVSDMQSLGAQLTDAALVNPWGVSYGGTNPFWISNAGSNTSTFYSVNPTTGAVSKAGQVAVPGKPTGQVFNGTAGFVVSQGGKSGPALFIFDGQDGSITGWNPTASAAQAIVAATGAAGSSYWGLALGTRSGAPVLYAANVGLGRIDVYDQNFKATTVPGGFADPNLPAGDKPLNIANINGSLYVTYGEGPTGVVDVFDVDGKLTQRLATGGTLSNPWGIALAPADFGPFSNAILVGNFNFGNPAAGPGTISAFDPATGRFMGLLEDTEGNPIWIDGLWALMFGNGGSGGAKNVLYFTAGIQNQQHGLFGSIAVAP